MGQTEPILQTNHCRFCGSAGHDWWKCPNRQPKNCSHGIAEGACRICDSDSLGREHWMNMPAIETLIDECAKFACHRCKKPEIFGLAYYEPEDMEWQHIVKYSDHDENLTCDASEMRKAAMKVINR